MEMFYNSEDYCVVEFPGFGDSHKHPEGGFEIVDKRKQVGLFIHGANARQFRLSITQMRERKITPSLDEVDEFLASYSALMTQPVILH